MAHMPPPQERRLLELPSGSSTPQPSALPLECGLWASDFRGALAVRVLGSQIADFGLGFKGFGVAGFGLKVWGSGMEVIGTGEGVFGFGGSSSGFQTRTWFTL